MRAIRSINQAVNPNRNTTGSATGRLIAAPITKLANRPPPSHTASCFKAVGTFFMALLKWVTLAMAAIVPQVQR